MSESQEIGTSASPTHEAARVLNAYAARLKRLRKDLDAEWRILNAKKYQSELKAIDPDIDTQSGRRKTEERQKIYQQTEDKLKEREAFLDAQTESSKSSQWKEKATAYCWHCGFSSHLSIDCYEATDIQGYKNHVEYRYRPEN
jgi:hypothetical protein